jgi:hypothetical protein
MVYQAAQIFDDPPVLIYMKEIFLQGALTDPELLELALIIDLVSTQIIKDLHSSGLVAICLKRTTPVLYGILCVSKDISICDI